MRLREWIDQFPVSQRRLIREALGAATDVSEMAVRHWANGTRRVPGPKCIPIEQFTDQQVTCYEIRPDIFAKPLPPRAIKRLEKALA
jgi:DNA-binding transcriptional regulator YdaS (Cro superfamily)